MKSIVSPQLNVYLNLVWDFSFTGFQTKSSQLDLPQMWLLENSIHATRLKSER